MIGCGSVKGGGGAGQDAASDGPNVCTIRDTVDSCGALCTRCPPPGDRTTPTCDGTSCGLACLNNAPRCTDATCSRLVWTFDTNSLAGITPRAPAGLALAVRNHAGNLALAVDVVNPTEISFRVPLCLSGTVQLQTKTLTATIFFDGQAAGGDQFFVQTSVPMPMTGAFLTTKSLPAGTAFAYSAPLSMSQFSNTATDVVFQLGSLGAPFTGTIWVDDIKIE